MNTSQTSKEQHRQSQYEAVWTALSDTHERAKINVTGTAEEAQLLASGAPDARPPYITECSTPQELETYLKRAGFSEIQIRSDGLFVRVWGHKPKGNPGDR